MTNCFVWLPRFFTCAAVVFLVGCSQPDQSDAASTVQPESGENDTAMDQGVEADLPGPEDEYVEFSRGSLEFTKLSAEQSAATAHFFEGWVGHSEIGFETINPDVVVAELWFGSGVAYTEWVVLQKDGEGKWSVTGEPTETIIFDPDIEYRFINDGDKLYFEVRLSSRDDPVRLPIPNSAAIGSSP